MELLTERELVSAPSLAWRRLEKENQIAIASEGKVVAIMLGANKDNLDDLVNDLHKLRAKRLIKSIREKGANRKPISDEEIEAEIKAARAERRAKQGAKNGD
jgi:fructose-1,6-bisphosphatase/sedoheptulose 1,7-bisphosphatase-like protein